MNRSRHPHRLWNEEEEPDPGYPRQDPRWSDRILLTPIPSQDVALGEPQLGRTRKHLAEMLVEEP